MFLSRNYILLRFCECCIFVFNIYKRQKADNCCTLAIEQLPNQVASGEKSATPVPDDVQQTMKEEEMVATKEEEDMMDEGDYEEDSPPEDGGGIVGPNIKPRSSD